jgi:hypothetical protein
MPGAVVNVHKVVSGIESANFSKAVIDELRRLRLIEPQGSALVQENVTVFYYRPVRHAVERGKW